MPHFLVLGATGGTGKHFVRHALSKGDKIRALVRNPAKIPPDQASSPNLEVITGSITDLSTINFPALVSGITHVVIMLGDKSLQVNGATPVCNFMKLLVPAMRAAGVKRLLYQAGGFSRPYGGSLTPLLWVLRYTIARGFEGQHRDNEAVMEYLATEGDVGVEWSVHRAGISGEGATKGMLRRSEDGSLSIGNFVDCAVFSYETVVRDEAAVGKTYFSVYAKG